MRHEQEPAVVDEPFLPGGGIGIDLSAIGPVVASLQSQGHPLSAPQRAEVAALKARLCAAAWQNAEERNTAYVLVLHLELLLLGPQKAASASSNRASLAARGNSPWSASREEPALAAR
jgi:hypothetical protein